MNTAIILAGGSGSRMKSEIPKQYMKLGDRMVIYYSIKAFQDNEYIDNIILVTSKEYIGFARNNFMTNELSKVTDVVEGGKERYDSVYSALKKVNDDGKVLIHDGARPCITTEVINRCIEGLDRYDACIAAVPVKDTIKIADEEQCVKTTPARSTLWQIQTPQAFRNTVVNQAYRKLYELGNFTHVTDDAMVVERYTDKKIKLIMGDYRNIKITTPDDMEIAGRFISDISGQRNG